MGCSTFFAARGTVYAYQPQQGEKQGFYQLNPAINGSNDGSDHPVLILGVELSDVDLVAPMPLLNGYKALYTFGRDFGNITIHGEVLLGPTAKTARSLGNIIDYFETNRVSKLMQTVAISLPGDKSYKVYLTGLAIGHPDKLTHIQPFAFAGIIADPVS